MEKYNISIIGTGLTGLKKLHCNPHLTLYIKFNLTCLHHKVEANKEKIAIAFHILRNSCFLNSLSSIFPLWDYIFLIWTLFLRLFLFAFHGVPHCFKKYSLSSGRPHRLFSFSLSFASSWKYLLYICVSHPYLCPQLCTGCQTCHT